VAPVVTLRPVNVLGTASGFPEVRVPADVSASSLAAGIVIGCFTGANSQDRKLRRAALASKVIHTSLQRRGPLAVGRLEPLG